MNEKYESIVSIITMSTMQPTEWAPPFYLCILPPSVCSIFMCLTCVSSQTRPRPFVPRVFRPCVSFHFLLCLPAAVTSVLSAAVLGELSRDVLCGSQCFFLREKKEPGDTVLLKVVFFSCCVIFKWDEMTRPLILQ